MKSFQLHDFARGAASWTGPLVSICLVMLVGCGGSTPEPTNRVATVPVKGRVLVNGSPSTAAPAVIYVKAHLIGGESEASGVPGGTCDPEGNFTLATYGGDDGIPVGEYKLTFELRSTNLLRGRKGADKFEGKFNNPDRSEHSVSVSESSEPIDLGTIDLSTEG